MKTNTTLILATVMCAATAARAEGWRFSVGPAWRSEVKMETRGATSVPTIAASHTPDATHPKEYDRNPATDGWSPSDAEVRPDPSPFAPAGGGDTLWAIGGTYTETVVTPNSGVAGIDASDSRSSTGVKAKLGYDFFEAGDFSFGLDVLFAGYWNLRSTFTGSAGGATRRERSVTDWWFFSGGPATDMTLDDGWSIDETFSDTTYGDWHELSPLSGHAVRGRLNADLYQVGIGPTVTWHAFSWLDAYVGVAALANIARLDVDSSSGEHTSQTDCRFGVGADIGLAAYLTENLGLYAEVGYEWVDSFDATAGGISADVDFSSLVVSAGLAFRF